MFAIVTVALLVVACLFQTVLPHPAPTPEKSEDATQQPATKQKTLSVNWEVSIPFVGCENGTPVLNIEVPDANAPTALCPGVQPPDVFPQSSRTTARAAQDGAYESGTVIVMGVSHEKIVIAADSRNVLLIVRTLADGSVERKIKYDDCACKLIQLTPTILFAADGQVSASKTIPATILYDAQKLARLAARNYHSSSKEEQLAGGRIAAIATRWAWDVDFRMHHAFANGWTPIETLEGIFAGSCSARDFYCRHSQTATDQIHVGGGFRHEGCG